MALNSNPDFSEWMDIYKNLLYWELEMERAIAGNEEIFQAQKQEANTEFFQICFEELFFLDKRKSSTGARNESSAD